MPYNGPVEALDAVVEFLTSSTGNRLSFNDELEQYNTAKGLTLANVETFTSPLILGPESNAPGVIGGVEWLSFGPEDGNNSRSRVHELALAFWVPSSSYSGDYSAAMRAAMHYLNVAQGMWARATWPETYGADLNNGGSVAPGRVLRSEIKSAEMQSFQTGANSYNYWPTCRVSVQLAGDYPGT